jgi:CRISPR-associated protein Cas1
VQPILISGFGTSINVEKRRLVIFNKNENSRIEFLPHQIPYDTLILDNHSGSITLDALRWLVKMDVSVCLLDWTGAHLGTFLPEAPVSARLRIKQYQKHIDSTEKSKIARAILDEKIGKSHDLLIGLSSYYTEIDKASVDKVFNELKSKYNHTSDLLAYEGNIAIFYWDQLSKVFNKLAPEFNFTSRNGRRHSWNTRASSEINAMLNYSYALTESVTRRMVSSLGLDSSISFLHSLLDSRSSLIYDLLEISRAGIADLAVIQMLENKKLQKSGFIWGDSLNVRLRPDTARALLERVRLNLNARTTFNGKQCTYENILYENVRMLANYIIGKSSFIKFNMPKLEIRRLDDIELRNKILNMTSEERNKLGLRRNTYFYMAKNIRAGKRIKIYDKVMSKIVD